MLEDIALMDDTKRVLTEVSEEWGDVTTPFVFKFLFLGDKDKWCAIADLIEKSKKAGVFRQGVGVGIHIRRLELGTSIWNDAQVASVTSILKACPMLSVLIVGSEPEFGDAETDGAGGLVVPRAVLNAIIARPSSNLRALNFKTPLDFCQDPDEDFPFLAL